jgi:hypothetical protein
VDLELDDDQRFFQETTKRFLESEVPIAEVRRLAEVATGFDREILGRQPRRGLADDPSTPTVTTPSSSFRRSRERPGCLSLISRWPS